MFSIYSVIYATTVLCIPPKQLYKFVAWHLKTPILFIHIDTQVQGSSDSVSVKHHNLLFKKHIYLTPQLSSSFTQNSRQ